MVFALVLGLAVGCMGMVAPGMAGVHAPVGRKHAVDRLAKTHEKLADARRSLSISATPNLQGIVSVLDFGADPSNGTDNTGAFQKAINSLGSGGGVVYVPPGLYAFEGVLNVSAYVSLVGVMQYASAHTVGQTGGSVNGGSVLLVRSGRGNADGTAFLTMADNSAVQGLVFYYDEQQCSRTPVAYPYTINMVGTDVAVMDSEILNAYQAIRAVGAPRHYIARTYGQLLLQGVFIDQTYDIGRVEDVHFNPWWCGEAVAFATQNGVFLTIARSDWEYVLNTFVFGAAHGYRFIKSSTGACNGNFVGIGADLCANSSVLVEDADPWGIDIVNGEFTSFCDHTFCNTTADSTQIVVADTNTGSVRIVNSAFWGPSHANVRVAGGTVSVMNSIFNAWDAANHNRASVEVSGGSIQLIGNDFQMPNKIQISIGANVQRAVILGNLIAGPENIVVNGTGQVIEKGYNAAK